MCRKFFPGISGGVLTPLTPPLDPPLEGINGLAQHYITTKFTRIRDCHGISTRSALAGNLTVPKPNVECFKQSSCFMVLMHGTLSQLMFASLQTCVYLTTLQGYAPYLILVSLFLLYV